MKNNWDPGSQKPCAPGAYLRNYAKGTLKSNIGECHYDGVNFSGCFEPGVSAAQDLPWREVAA